MPYRFYLEWYEDTLDDSPRHYDVDRGQARAPLHAKMLALFHSGYYVRLWDSVTGEYDYP